MSTTPATQLVAGAASAATRFSVELLIRDFQVTATNRLIASSYAASDARELLQTWNYTIGRVCPATEDLTPSIQSLPIAVHVKDSVPDGGRERLYSCDASYTVVVDAPSRYLAGEAALRLVASPCRLESQLAAYRDQVFWDKLMPLASAPFDQMAKVLRRRGFEANIRASSANDAQRFLVIDVAESGEPVGTLALVKHVTENADAERQAIGPCLHFTGPHDVEASSVPADHPDVWLNDARVSSSDIACLDVDAFDAFFDVVLDQREAARHSESPAAYG